MDLLRIRQFDPGPGPDIDHGPQTYIGYYQPDIGVQLVFAQRAGVVSGTLWHSDIGFEEWRTVTGDDVPKPGDLLLALDEYLWLLVCWKASERFREA
jgi:hypothetical protein